jgi:hypothetical protein
VSINLRKLVLSPTGSINLGFILREDLLLCSSYLSLGVPNWAVNYTPSGLHLKLTLRRSVDQQLMNRWYDLVSVAESIQYTGEVDAIIWKYESSGVYLVSSLYAIVNFKGVTPVHIPAIWQIKVPPRLHVFLWLWANNKILTRDNLVKSNT